MQHKYNYSTYVAYPPATAAPDTKAESQSIGEPRMSLAHFFPWIIPNALYIVAVIGCLVLAFRLYSNAFSRSIFVSLNQATSRRDPSAGRESFDCRNTLRHNSYSILRKPKSTLALRSQHRLRQLRHDLKEIAHNAEVRHFKDRRILIFVDSDHRLRTLHSHQVLDRP